MNILTAARRAGYVLLFPYGNDGFKVITARSTGEFIDWHVVCVILRVQIVLEMPEENCWGQASKTFT